MEPRDFGHLFRGLFGFHRRQRDDEHPSLRGSGKYNM